MFPEQHNLHPQAIDEVDEITHSLETVRGF